MGAGATPRTPSALAADGLLLAVVLLLTGVGAVMVYSASAVTASARYHDSFHFLWRQLLAAGAGLGRRLQAGADALAADRERGRHDHNREPSHAGTIAARAYEG